MPDTSGRLTLAEMRTQVRRKLDLLRFEIAATGEESNLQQLDPLISNEDLNMYLNMALARRCIDVNIADNTIMADEEQIDVVASQVEYPMPDDLMFLRTVYYKPQSVTNSLFPMSQRYALFEVDTNEEINIQPAFDSIASFRRRLNMIVLNEIPQLDNPGGLMVDYVKMMNPLLADDQLLETPLAWAIQQVIMQDAAVECTVQKLKLDATELRLTQQELVQQLHMAVVNYHAPKTIRLTSNVKMAYSPFARRPSSWQGIPGWSTWAR